MNVLLVVEIIEMYFNTLFILLEGQREQENQPAICWFSSQMPTTARAWSTETGNPELHPDSPESISCTASEDRQN